MLGLVGGALVLVLVAGAAVVLATRSGGDERGWGDYGSGPGSEPDQRWAVDLDLGDQDADVLSDGERVFVIVEQPSEDDEDEYTSSTTATVTVYDASDGDELWDAEVGSSISDTPVRPLGDDGVLLADDDDDTTRLVDPGSGDELWEADGLPVETQLSSGFGPRIDPGDLDLVLLTNDDEDEPRVSAVDRESGDEIWDAEGEDALVCGDVVVTIVQGESDDEDSFAPAEGPIAARDPGTGDEIWSRQALPGLCDDDEIALATADAEVVLTDVRTGDENRTIDLGEAGDFVIAIPFGDHVAVSSYTFSIDDEDEGPTALAAIYPRDGGEPTWESDDDESFVFPATDAVAITAQDEGEEVTFIRAEDGEEVGDLTVQGDDNGCNGAFARQAVVICESGTPDVTSYDLDGEVDELWSIDAGADVAQVAVGGARLFVITADDELLAFG